MTTIIYDQNGRTIMTQSGDMGVTSVDVIVKEIPAGYYVKSVNVETGEPVLAAFPKSETDQRLDELEAQIAALIGTEEE